MLANWITLSRFPLLLAIVLILLHGGTTLRLSGTLLLVIGLMLDTVDGMVARRSGRTSLFGAVLDIAADRTYELVLWTVFAAIGMLPLAIPLIVIARTTLTDAFRSIGVSQGTAPFDQHRTALASFLVGSPIMRTGYSITKVVTFTGLALAQALSGMSGGPGRMAVTLAEAMRWTAWSAVAFCVLRGLPVIIRSLRRYWSVPADAAG
jgi:CDP-diacylglycerol--glycerol-3-phosphate 3-phosphatidyltransferase